MKPVDQPGMTLYTADGCDPLPVVLAETTDGVPVLVSAWDLTVADLDEINRTGRVWLQVIGNAHPPVRITVACPYDISPIEVQADHRLAEGGGV